MLSRKPENVLELGIGSGYVTMSLLHALRFNGRGKLTSVDSWFDWRGVEPPGVANLRGAGVNVVTSGEEEFVRAAPADAYDLLVSDADHFRSHLWLDQHLRIVAHDGFLFFHDTEPAADVSGPGHDRRPDQSEGPAVLSLQAKYGAGRAMRPRLALRDQPEVNESRGRDLQQQAA